MALSPSVQLAEIQRVFEQHRVPISQADPQFNNEAQLAQLGHPQIDRQLKHMLTKEQICPYQHSPLDYIAQNHANRLDPQMRQDAYLHVLQFAIQTDCLD